jgi:hypothetical protein
MLVFSSKGSIPERISDGDLDGDMYLVCWDDEIISHISKQSTTEGQGKRAKTNEDPLIDTSFPIEHEDGKVQQAIVSRKKSANEYVVNIGTNTLTMTKEEILRDRDYVEGVAGHKGTGRYTEVQVKWATGERTWVRLSSMQWQIPEMLAEYARKNNLLHCTGWHWAKRHVRDSEIASIEGHKKEKGLILVRIVWDDGDYTWESIDDMKPVATDLLADYAFGNYLENTKGWIWVKTYKQEKLDCWFERAQDYAANIQLLRDYDRLTTALHSAYKKSQQEGGDEETTQALGRAFKNSIDIRKHGGKVDLPFELRSYLREKALHKYL